MVNRDGFWKIMEKFGCPSKFITIFRQFRDGMVKVLNDADESELKPFQFRRTRNKAAFSPRRSSVWYSRPCWQMPSMTTRTEYRSDTGLTAGR